MIEITDLHVDFNNVDKYANREYIVTIPGLSVYDGTPLPYLEKQTLHFIRDKEPVEFKGTIWSAIVSPYNVKYYYLHDMSDILKYKKALLQVSTTIQQPQNTTFFNLLTELTDIRQQNIYFAATHNSITFPVQYFPFDINIIKALYTLLKQNVITITNENGIPYRKVTQLTVENRTAGELYTISKSARIQANQKNTNAELNFMAQNMIKELMLFLYKECTYDTVICIFNKDVS